MNPMLETRAPRLAFGIGVLFALQLLFATPALAQQDAIISGRVVDVEGNPVAGAVVTVMSVDRGDSRELTANDDGVFFGRGFRPAENYVLQAQAEGFAPAQQELRATFGENEVDFTLPPADPNAGADVDYDALNALYDEGFKAWQAQDWAVAEERMATLLEGIEGLQGENVETMRLSAIEMLGVSHLQQGEIDESIAVFEGLLETDPDALAAHTWLGQGYAQKGDFDQAATHLQAAAELAPDNPEVQYNTGAVLLQVGEVEEGIAAMERAIELRPEFPVARKNLGYAYLRVERYQDAIDSLQAYLDQSPEASDRAEIEGMIEAIRAQIQQ